MKKIYVILLVFLVLAVFPSFAQSQGAEFFKQEGIASWYGREFEGRPTASGEIFDSSQLTAAHPNLPFGTMLIVTNLHNNKSVTVRINDRGPFVPARIIDVSRAAAEKLDMIVTGTAPVKIESLSRTVVSTTAVGALTERTQMSPQLNTQTSAQQTQEPVIPQAAIIQPVAAPVIVSQPVVVQEPAVIRLTPSINIVPEKNYRLQVGSFRVARFAVETFDRLKSAGLNPAYERYTDSGDSEFFRVVLAGIRGSDVQTVSEKLSAAGFREAIIREEN